MTSTERMIRKHRHTRVLVETLLETVLVGELLRPSTCVWLVSPWISDIGVVDNSRGTYDSLSSTFSPRRLRLSEVLGWLTHSGTRLEVVTRPLPHNTLFLERLKRVADGTNVGVVKHDDLHEKTLIGDDWVISGSMNFTINGVEVLDEAVSYKANRTAAASARVYFGQRWLGTP